MAGISINMNFDPDWIVSKTKTPEFCDKGNLKATYEREILGRYEKLHHELIPRLIQTSGKQPDESSRRANELAAHELLDYQIQAGLLRLFLEFGCGNNDAIITVAHLTKYNDLMELIKSNWGVDIKWSLYALSQSDTQAKLMNAVGNWLDQQTGFWQNLFLMVFSSMGNMDLYNCFETEYAAIVQGLNTCLGVHMSVTRPLLKVSKPQPAPQLTRDQQDMIIGKRATPSLPNDPTGGAAFNRDIPNHYAILMTRILPEISDFESRILKTTNDLNSMQAFFDILLQAHLIKLFYETGSQDNDAVTIIAHLSNYCDIWTFISHTSQGKIALNWFDYAHMDREYRSKLNTLIDAEIKKPKETMGQILTFVDQADPNRYYLQRIEQEVAAIVQNMNLCLGVRMNLSERFFSVLPTQTGNATPPASNTSSPSNQQNADTVCRPVSAYHPARFNIYADPSNAKQLMNDYIFIDGNIQTYTKISNLSVCVIAQEGGGGWIGITGIADNKNGNPIGDGKVFADLEGIRLRLFGRYNGVLNANGQSIPVIDLAACGGVLVPDVNAFLCTDVFDLEMKKIGMSRKNFIQSGSVSKSV